MTLRNFDTSKKFEQNFRKVPDPIKDAFYKQIQKFKLSHPDLHPSLRVKGVQGKKGIYEMTVMMGIRVTFEYIDDGVYFRNIGPDHDDVIKNA